MDTNEISKNIESENIEAVSIKNLIYLVRNQQVMVDSDLAMLYQVETKVLNQAITRNISRFPERFRFQLTKEENASDHMIKQNNSYCLPAPKYRLLPFFYHLLPLM